MVDPGAQHSRFWVHATGQSIFGEAIEDIQENSFLNICHSNDLDFIFKTGTSNDFGFTGAISIKLFLNELEDHNRFFIFNFNTNLYTQNTENKFCV